MSRRARPAPEAVLRFWFETARGRWFAADPALDAVIRRRFAPWLHAMDADPPDGDDRWLDAPGDGLALLIGLDQFPRNVWRGSNKAFALDGAALDCTLAYLDRGFDLALDAEMRPFAYMALMHAEDPDAQEACVALCEARLGPDSGTARHARAHRDVIARFERFPHRNAALGRESTPEEIAFLEGGGYAPGAKRPARSADRA